MKISTVIIGIVLFAVVTMILYGWGIVKQKNQTSDLMNLLFSKGQDKIKKYLKQHEYVTISQVASEIHAADARKAGIVVYFIGIQHLAAACKVCLNRKRGELCAFRINRGRKTRRAGADDDNVV